MMAEFLELLTKDIEVLQPLAFIWTAPRRLHEQSKGKLEKYYENSHALECSEFEDLDYRKISENEILFFNWESINKEDNIYIRENEKDNNLSAVIQRTKDTGCIIILVIDEVHHHATSQISQNLISDISPKLTIEVSATPIIENPDGLVNVPLEDVKAEGMIKMSVVLNPDFDNLLSDDKIESSLANGSDDLVLDIAIKKREELSSAYKEEGKNINPLLLIQLPDRITGVEDQLKSEVTRVLKSKYDISVENGKLGIYLSGEKENLENIKMNINETEVLIFKQAIALGWDCPRAHVLVLFRNWNSFTFSIQTVGRIIRMPEPDIGHYENNILNRGYIFTNLSRISIREDIAGEYLQINTSNRIENYIPIKLASQHLKRQRDRTRLSPLFTQLFLEVAKNYGLEKKIKTKGQKVHFSFITKYQTRNVGKLLGEDILADKIVDAENESDLQQLFDFFVRQNLTPFYPEDRSVGRVKEAIYHFFSVQLGIEYSKMFKDIMKIILSDKNVKHFANVLDMAKEKYSATVLKRENVIVVDWKWEIPISKNVGKDFKVLKAPKSVLQPFYYDFRWKPEKGFIDFLEKSKKVEWWYKNGVGDRTNFSIPYKVKDELKLFYLDFIVKLTDGRIGLFDTKSGFTIKSSPDKIDGLRIYLEEYGQKNNLFGGIVTNTDPNKFIGRWMIYNGLGADLEIGNFSNWNLLEI